MLYWLGLGLGIYYQMHIEFVLILLFASLFTLFITVMLEGIIGKYGLPYLSISFLFGIWIVTLASREYTSLSISERGIYVSNELFTLGGAFFVGIYNWFANLNLHESIVIYFRSLGAIFFQYHLVCRDHYCHRFTDLFPDCFFTIAGWILFGLFILPVCRWKYL